MKGKYFKLKVLVIVSFCLITVGFTGSYKMFCSDVCSSDLRF